MGELPQHTSKVFRSVRTKLSACLINLITPVPMISIDASAFLKLVTCINFKFLDNIRDLITEEQVYPTRSSTNLRLPFPRLNIHKQTVIYNGIKFWNDLSNKLKSKPSLNSFKFHLKKIISNNNNV